MTRKRALWLVTGLALTALVVGLVLFRRTAAEAEAVSIEHALRAPTKVTLILDGPWPERREVSVSPADFQAALESAEFKLLPARDAVAAYHTPDWFVVTSASGIEGKIMALPDGDWQWQGRLDGELREIVVTSSRLAQLEQSLRATQADE